MFSNKFRATMLAAVLGSVLAVTGCGSSSTPSSQPAGTTPTGATGGKTLNIGLKADPPSLDPYASSALVDRMVQNSIYDKLFDLDKDGKIVPVLVDSYEMSKDGKTYTFKLKKGIKFQDGTDFNADAVKFNLERDKDKTSKRKAELSLLDKVTVVDANTVKVELKKPYAPFLSVLTDRSGMMASPDAVKKYGKDYLNHPVGTGPYAFVEHVKGDHITLKRNDNYWNGKPKLAGVTYRIFTNGVAAVQNLRSGQLDMIDDIPTKQIPTVKGDPNLAVVAEPGMGYQGFHFNVTKAPFNNKYIREAVDHAVDREAFIKVLLDGYGSPAWTPWAPGNLAYGDTDKIDKPNPQEIKALLAKGGQPNGFTFDFQIGTSPVQEQFGAIIQSMLKPYGITVNLQKVEFGQLIDNGAKGNFQALQLGWSGRPDPDGSFYDFVTTGAPNNYGGFSDPQIDQLAKQARTESDPAKRKAIYDKAMKILQDQGEYVYIYHMYNIFGMSKKVSGFVYNPDGVIRTATLDKQ